MKGTEGVWVKDHRFDSIFQKTMTTSKSENGKKESKWKLRQKIRGGSGEGGGTIVCDASICIYYTLNVEGEETESTSQFQSKSQRAFSQLPSKVKWAKSPLFLKPLS